MDSTFPHADKLADWIIERELIRMRRQQGQKPPWTTDRELSGFRFCNVNRENDAVTKWIHENWRQPNQRDTMLWHAMLAARMFNWPPTLKRMGYPEPWSVESVEATLRPAWERGDKLFTGAYIVSTNGKKMDKLTYVLEVLTKAYYHGQCVQEGMTLAGAHQRLQRVEGVGSFMAGQIVADLKYTPVLQGAEDWWDWAAPGPGSMRGLNRMMDRPLKQKYRNPEFSQLLRDLRATVYSQELREGFPRIHLQDLQNCLCEVDKWLRLKDGGRTRNTYKSHEGQY